MKARVTKDPKPQIHPLFRELVWGDLPGNGDRGKATRAGSKRLVQRNR